MRGQWSAEEVRRMGADVTEWAAEFFGTLEERPISPAVTPAETDALFAGPLPRRGVGWERAWAEAVEKVVPASLLVPHPRYFGLMLPTPLAPAVFAEVMVSALSQNMGAWSHSPAGTALDRRVLRWLADLAGYPAGAAGVLCSGGSVANLMALRVALSGHFPGARETGVAGMGGHPVFYVSEEAHFSLHRAATVLGLGTEGMRAVPVDGRGRMDPAALRRMVAGDRGAGRLPFAVVAIAGTTSAGAVDPLEELGAIARGEGLRYHVDAAWGGGLLLSDRHRGLLRGIDRADTITLDPHKWFFMPSGTGALLARDGQSLPRTFEQHAVYIPTAADERVDFRSYGIAGSRRMDSLKLWLCFRAFGADWFRDTIDRHMELAAWLRDRVEAAPEWEMVVPPDMNILCFRYRPAGVPMDGLDALQDRVADAVVRDGRCWISATTVAGVRAVRWMALSPALTAPDVELFWEVLNELAPGAV